MPLTTGLVLNNRYRIVRLLGQGGFGAVYRAWDVNLERVCALKENLDTMPAAQKQFEREAKILAGLSHPNLPQIYDHFILPGQGQYLVMEFIEGEDLDTMLAAVRRLPGASAGLDAVQVIPWILQICNALDYLHGQTPPVIHRDIKPSNIRITPKGKAVLVDFGIAKIYDPSLKTTLGARAATPGYAPPEQFGLGTTDAQSDVYALAATTYHLLTGVVPPAAMDVVAGNAPPPRPAQQTNPKVSPAIGKALEGGMQLSRAKRTASAVELARALEAAQSSQHAPTRRAAAAAQAVPKPMKAPAAAVPPVSQKPVGKRRRLDWRWLVGGLVLLLAVVLIVLNLPRGVPRSSGLVFTPTLPGLAGTQAPRSPTGTLVQASVTQPRPTLTPFPTAKAASATRSPTAQRAPTLTPPFTATALAGSPGRTAVPLPSTSPKISAANVNQIVQLARWGKGLANQVAYSPDGRLVAVASPVGVTLYESQTFQEVLIFPIDNGASSVAFSPDGKNLASGSDDGLVQLWQASNGALTRTMKGHQNSIFNVIFSPDGKLLASGARDEPIRLWQVADGTQVQAPDDNRSTCLAFSPDGTLLASGSDDMTIHLFRLTDGRLVHILKGHTDIVVSLAFSPDGKLLASGTSRNDARVRVWRMPDGVLQSTSDRHYWDIITLAFSPDGKELAVGSGNRVQLYLVEDSPEVREIMQDGNVRSLAYSPDGQQVAVAAETITLWRPEDRVAIGQLEGHNGRLGAVAVSPDGKVMATGSQEYGTIYLRDAATGELLHTLGNDERGVTGLAFSPDGSRLASAALNVRLWSAPDGEVLRTLERPEGMSSPSGVAFSPDGSLVASGFSNGNVYVWRVQDGALIHTLTGHSRQVTGVAFSPGGMSPGELLASSSWDTTVRLWSPDQGNNQFTLTGHPWRVFSLAFSPDGLYLTSGSGDGAILLWQAGSFDLLRTLKVGGANVDALVFSPDSSLLAAGNGDPGEISLWTIPDGKLLLTLLPQIKLVSGLVFYPNGGFLAAISSFDGMIYIWGIPE